MFLLSLFQHDAQTYHKTSKLALEPIHTKKSSKYTKKLGQKPSFTSPFGRQRNQIILSLTLFLHKEISHDLKVRSPLNLSLGATGHPS
jgi:hypothetical protein